MNFKKIIILALFLMSLGLTANENNQKTAECEKMIDYATGDSYCLSQDALNQTEYGDSVNESSSH